ncbi:hypothetical protein HPP92_024724 [Vanilla planifolia]|nr:hypothetical protein HPP92_024724 [Vanilla planifolia]
MGSWQTEQGLHQKDATRTPRSGRPPPSPDFQSVPKWERRFCNQIPWNKLCEKKKLIHLFPKVLAWDDFAGKEAFDNAKSRFWAEMNGIPCNIPVPDPDMYIDVVDYETSVDPRLLKDLYKEPPPPPPSQEDIVDYDSVKITPTGWDVEDPSPTISNIPRFIIAEPSLWDEGVDLSSIENGNACCFDVENVILRNEDKDESIRIVPTGWGDEEDTLQSRLTNSSFSQPSTNRHMDGEHHVSTKMDAIFGSAEARNGGLQRQDWVDVSSVWRKVNSCEHRERVREKDGGHWRRDGGRVGSKHAHLRSHVQDYERKKYGNGHHWQEKSPIERGLSCAPVSHW